MAAVSAPLMSLDASGTVAGAIVFSKWKGRPYVRRHAIPANPQSALQVSVRAMMRFLSQWWGDTAVDPTSWLPSAASLRISAFNAYIGENLVRWRQYRCPSNATPATELGVAPSAPVTTPTNGVHSVMLSIAAGASAPDMAWIIHRSTVPGFTPSLSNVVAVVGALVDPTIFIDHPLAPGTYKYRIMGTMNTGKVGTLEVERTGIAT